MVYMIFNQPGDWSEILYYNGDYYSNGSEVKIKDEYIQTHTYNGQKIWKYARFGNKTTYNRQIAYLFWKSKSTYVDFYAMNLDYNTRGD